MGGKKVPVRAFMNLIEDPPLRVFGLFLIYNSSLKAKAENLLKLMQKLHEEGSKDICPSTVSFSSVLNAYANSKEKDSAQKAEKILKHMQRLYDAGNQNVQPNTICFATVIKAYSRFPRQLGTAQVRLFI